VLNKLAGATRAFALADPVIQLPVSATQIADFRLGHGIPSDKKSI